MIGMQYNLPEKVALSEVAGFGSEAKWKKKQGSFASNEPISVLDTRSPSPSTSTSTFSSSLGGTGGTGSGGGSGSADNPASLAAVSDNNPPQKWPVSMPPEKGPAAVTDSATACGGRKDEWASELQPIPAGLEVSGGERFGFGLEDWESLVSESSQDQSLFRWISGEANDPSFSLKQLLQGANPNDIDGYGTTGSVVDQTSVYGAASAGVSTGNAMTTLTPVLSGGGSVSSSSEMGNCKAGSNPQIPILGSSLSKPFAGGMIYQQQQLDTPEEKPQIFNPQQFMNQQQISQQQQQVLNPNLFPPSLYAPQDPLRLLQPQPKRQNLGVADPKVPFLDPAQELLLRKLGSVQQMQTLTSHPLMAPKRETAEHTAARHHHQQQVIYDELYKAAELMLAGNFPHAQGILARLNHQLSPPLVVAKPFQRAAFYFKEALQLPIPATPKAPTPFDGILKMGAYKLLSEISPLVHFVNFTSNQALLEALDHDYSESVHVHVIDFDIGFGAQWASFMQELPGRIRVASLKITAFASPSTHHPLELGLMHENLAQFANEFGVKFELEVVNFDAFFGPNSYPLPHFRSSEKEAIVVNFPLWVCSNRLSGLHSVLLFIKQLSPKIVVSLESGCERADLPFSHHLLHALQYYEVLLDSIDAASATPETMNKIEKFLLQPRIESVVLGRLHAPGQMPHWKALFASAGFSPVGFSNFAESQAECVVKRSQVRGFHVEKRQGSLVLCWQRREIMSASAWRC